MTTVLRMMGALPIALVTSACTAGDAPNAVEKADTALVQGNYDTAIAHFDEAIRIDPKFVRGYHGRGVAFFHKGVHDKAIASYTEALRLEPQNDVALFDRGLAHWEKGDPKQALADFKQAIQINPKNDS